MNGYGARYQKFQTVQTQNLFDLTISGNTSGALALISSGTLTLAGGNNITLSQAGNAVTISGPNGFSAGISDALGNTSGTTGLGTQQLVLVGGTNITLSQSINGQSVTVSILGVVGTAVASSFLAGVSSQGNTSGTTGLVSNQLLLVGGNNITLSQSINVQSATVTISAPNAQTGISGIAATNTTYTSGTVLFTGSNMITVKSSGIGQTIVIDATSSQSVQTQNLIDVTLSGNTTGTLALISSGTLTLAGGNNITLSQSGNAVTISAFNQSEQTQNLIDVTLSGNTSGALALVSSGTLTLAGGNNITLSQAGNAVTISAPNQTGWVLVTDKLVTETNLQAFTITGIGTSNGILSMHYYISNSSNSSLSYAFLYNGISDGITRQRFIAGDTALAGDSSAAPYREAIQSNGTIFGNIQMMIHTTPVVMLGKRMLMPFSTSPGLILGGVGLMGVFQTHTDATNVTNLVISANSASGIAPNSRFVLWKKV